MSTQLPDIMDVAPIGPDDAACLAELREILARHGALERFGLNLLHDHFAITDDELLVETCDHDNRTLTIAPMKAVDFPTDLNVIETNWVFDPDTGGDTAMAPKLVCKVGCFSDLKDNHNVAHDKVWG